MLEKRVNNMKMVIVALYMTIPAMYSMDPWAELIECANKIKSKKQELEAIMKNNDDSRAMRELKRTIMEAINKYDLEKEIVHHRIIHRGVEVEKTNKAKL